MVKIYQTAFRVGDDVYSIDTIHHEGGVWLVPEWNESPYEKTKKPARIVRIDHLPYQKPDDMVFDYVINCEFRIDALYEQTATDFEIVHAPDLTFPLQNALDLN